MDLETARLTLVPSDPRHLLILLEQPDAFAVRTGMAIDPGLAAFYGGPEVSPHWIEALRDSSGPDPWRHGFFLMHRARRMVIGSAGFKGPPDAAGMVEIAYGVAPSFEGQGLATEAAGALVRFASARKDVRLIRAHTLPQPNASTHVLRKNGFHHRGLVDDPDDGPVWRWEREPLR